MINPEYLKDLRPPFQVLETCHLVKFGGRMFIMREMKKWCLEQQLSLVWAELIYTSDIDYRYKHIAGFYFIEAKDATLFSLKFK
jgi:hypothetical protein